MPFHEVFPATSDLVDPCVIGVDYGTKRYEWVCVRHRATSTFKAHPREDQVLATWVIARNFRKEISEHFTQHAIIRAHMNVEAPITGGSGNAQTAAAMAMTAGALIATVHDLDVNLSVKLVLPASWKSTVVGKGNASKTQVAAWLREQHPDYSDLCGSSQDLRDATCLGLYTYALGVGQLERARRVQ